MEPYFLCPHIRACATPDGAVFLDLKRDEYVGVTLKELKVLDRLVQGRLSTCDGRPNSFEEVPPLTDQEVATLTARLVDEEILTQDDSSGVRASPIALQRADSILFNAFDSEFPSPRLTDVLRFCKSYLVATLQLKYRTLNQIVSGVERHKASGCSKPPPDVMAVRRLVGVFSYLRPFLYSRRDHCLLDSLTLMYFLFDYGAFPAWVFGVRTRPFQAHSWLQIDRYVLNDVPDSVNTFTPILMV